MASAAGCYDGAPTVADVPPQQSAGRILLQQQFLHDGARRAVRQSVEVRDPLSANSNLELRLRNLGNPTTGDIARSVVNLGAAIEGSIVLPTDRGPLTLFLRSDGTLADTPQEGPLVTLPIPAGGEEALVFRATLQPLVLAGIYRFALDITTDEGSSNIELALVVP